MVSLFHLGCSPFPGILSHCSRDSCENFLLINSLLNSNHTLYKQGQTDYHKSPTVTPPPPTITVLHLLSLLSCHNLLYISLWRLFPLIEDSQPALQQPPAEEISQARNRCELTAADSQLYPSFSIGLTWSLILRILKISIDPALYCELEHCLLNKINDGPCDSSCLNQNIRLNCFCFKNQKMFLQFKFCTISSFRLTQKHLFCSHSTGVSQSEHLSCNQRLLGYHR